MIMEEEAGYSETSMSKTALLAVRDGVQEELSAEQVDGAVPGSDFPNTLATSGSDCKVAGEVTLSVARVKGKAAGQPLPFLCHLGHPVVIPPRVAQLASHTYFKISLPQNTCDLAQTTWWAPGKVTEKQRTERRVKSASATCSFPKLKVCLWSLILLGDTNVSHSRYIFVNLLGWQSTIFFSCINNRGTWHLNLSPWYDSPLISHPPVSLLHQIAFLRMKGKHSALFALPKLILTECEGSCKPFDSL